MRRDDNIFIHNENSFLFFFWIQNGTCSDLQCVWKERRVGSKRDGEERGEKRREMTIKVYFDSLKIKLGRRE
jgi:hypothetical protein